MIYVVDYFFFFFFDDMVGIFFKVDCWDFNVFLGGVYFFVYGNYCCFLEVGDVGIVYDDFFYEVNFINWFGVEEVVYLECNFKGFFVGFFWWFFVYVNEVGKFVVVFVDVFFVFFEFF